MPGSLFSRILPSSSTLASATLAHWRARLASLLPSTTTSSSSSSPRFLGGLDAAGNDIPRAALEIRAMEAGLGPLSFVLSWYCVGLVCMGLLFNRIHHIVRPPPPSFHRSQLQALRAHQHSNRAHHPHPSLDDPPPPPSPSFFQQSLNLARRALVSPVTRKLMRIPSTVLLFRVLFQLGVILAQSVGFQSGGWLISAKVWEGMMAMEMEEVCWRTFACVCFALVVGSVGRGLEGTAQLGTGFNLFGFAFLLHLYSSPLTHLGPSRGSKEAGSEAGLYRASRPDANVLFGITIAVLELSWIHANEMSSRLSRMRLLPTTVCGLIGLTHFTITLFRSPTRLPSFTFLTNLLSLLLLVVIGLTIVLNAFTQLLTLGTILPDQLLPHESVWPRWNEEFSLALLKAGTACMESSKLGGLGNEVALIELPAESYITLSSSTYDLLEPPPSPSPYSSSSSSRIQIHQSSSPTRGFANLIPRVHPSSHAPGAPSPNDAETPWWKAARRFARALGRWFLGLGWAVLGKVPGGRWTWTAGRRAGRWVGEFRWSWRGVRWRRRGEVGTVVEGGLEDWEDEEEEEEEEEDMFGGERMETEGERIARLSEEEYERFIRGREEYPEESNEQDDPSFSYNSTTNPTSIPSRPRSYSHSSSSFSSSSSSSSSFHAEEDEPLSFYSHLPPSPTLPQTVLLAHMTSTSSSPLTRRRYASLLAPTSPKRDDSLASVVRERRRSSVGGAGGGAGGMMKLEKTEEEEQWEEERRRMCVVCVSEEREVILWPCACLALCDGCRSNLATRVNAGSHSCPCCRTKVEGYSRIFIP